jgi:hypothetical protein
MKSFKSFIAEDLRNWFDKDHPKGGWKRINSKGEAIGPCAREPGEPKPKCMSNEKRAQLSKKERASAVASKRKHDPNPERKGEPINVSNFGKGKISEDVQQLDEKNVPTSPEKWARAKALAKSKFDVYPSAYANGWASKKYKEMGGGWKSVSESLTVDEKFDLICMFDVIEHIPQDKELMFVKNIVSSLTDDAVLIMGTPNITANEYASPGSKEGHINLKSAETLKKLMLDSFHNVFIFSMNDEVVHTGFPEMCHYIIALGVQKKVIESMTQK